MNERNDFLGATNFIIWLVIISALVVTAIEMINRQFVVGIQWHPEMMLSNDSITLDLFKKFIYSCKV